MGEVVDAVRIAEPTEWNVVFHKTSTSRLLSFLAFGDFKHVSAFGYCVGFRAWVVYDVTWWGTRVWLADKAAIIAATRNCTIVRFPRTDRRMGMSSRLGLYCVTGVKHLLRLRCVAATPDQLYRHILRNGGVDIGSGQPAPAPADAA